MQIWQITHDFIGSDEHGRWGTSTDISILKKCPCNLCDMPISFRLKDDDGEIYYMGRMTQELYDSHMVLAPLHNWAMPNAGATSMEVFDSRRQEWVGI